MDSGRAVIRKVVKEEVRAKQEKKSKGKDKAKAKASSEEPEETFKSKSKPESKLVKPNTNDTVRPSKDFVGLSKVTSAPKRLNDIAQAPPEFKRAPARPSKVTGPEKAQSVISMAQKAMLDQERLKAIARYRELKAMRKQPEGEHN